MTDSPLGETEEPLSDVGQVEDRIMSLDGHVHTLMTAYADSAHIAVGGSAASGLVVYATFNNETFHKLVTAREHPSAELIVVAGGQPAQYKSKYVVGLDEAIAAARAFVRDGRLTSELTWDVT